jgi:hypothetical protein
MVHPASSMTGTSGRKCNESKLLPPTINVSALGRCTIELRAITSDRKEGLDV